MNKKIIVGTIIVLAIVGFIGISKFASSPKRQTVEEVPTPTVALPTITDDVIVDLTSKNDKRVVVLRLKNVPVGTESIDYELTYTTATGLPRGVLGKIKLAGEKQVVRDDITLGTCSRGSCVYDLGVKSVDLSLKFNLSSGQSSVFQKTYPL